MKLSNYYFTFGTGWQSRIVLPQSNQKGGILNGNRRWKIMPDQEEDLQ